MVFLQNQKKNSKKPRIFCLIRTPYIKNSIHHYSNYAIYYCIRFYLNLRFIFRAVFVPFCSSQYSNFNRLQIFFSYPTKQMISFTVIIVSKQLITYKNTIFCQITQVSFTDTKQA